MTVFRVLVCNALVLVVGLNPDLTEFCGRNGFGGEVEHLRCVA